MFHPRPLTRRCSFLGSRTASSPRSAAIPEGTVASRPYASVFTYHSPSTTESHLHPRAVHGRPRPGSVSVSLLVLRAASIFWIVADWRSSDRPFPCPRRLWGRTRGAVRFETPSTRSLSPLRGLRYGDTACAAPVCTLGPGPRPFERGCNRRASRASCREGEPSGHEDRRVGRAPRRAGDRCTCPGCLPPNASFSGERRPQDPSP